MPSLIHNPPINLSCEAKDHNQRQTNEKIRWILLRLLTLGDEDATIIRNVGIQTAYTASHPGNPESSATQLRELQISLWNSLDELSDHYNTLQWLRYSQRFVSAMRIFSRLILSIHELPSSFMAPSKSVTYADPQWSHNGSLRATPIFRPQGTYITLVQIVVNECLDRPN